MGAETSLGPRYTGKNSFFCDMRVMTHGMATRNVKSSYRSAYVEFLGGDNIHFDWWPLWESLKT